MLFECQATYLNSTFANIEAPDRHAAARRFRNRHTRWPEMVGDHIVSGICEACGHVIFENESFAADEDGVIVHAACPSVDNSAA